MNFRNSHIKFNLYYCYYHYYYHHNYIYIIATLNTYNLWMIIHGQDAIKNWIRFFLHNTKQTNFKHQLLCQS